MKKEKIAPKIAVLLKTQDEYDLYMKWAEKKWYKWATWAVPTEGNEWTEFKNETVVVCGDTLSYGGSSQACFDWYTILSLKEATGLKAKVTYAVGYVRNDGTRFTKNTIDSVEVSILETSLKHHSSEAKRINALLRAHRNLKF